MGKLQKASVQEGLDSAKGSSKQWQEAQFARNYVVPWG